MTKESGDKKLVDALSTRWSLIKKEYKIFSLENNRAFYHWRTVASRDEKIIPNQEAKALAEDVKLELKIEKEIGKSNPAPSKLNELAGTENAKIVMRPKTDYDRQGSAEHIVADHKKQIDDEFINNMKTTLSNPIDVTDKGTKENRFILFSNYINKDGKERQFKVVVENVGKGIFEIITAYPARKK